MGRTYEEVVSDISSALAQRDDPLAYTHRMALEPPPRDFNDDEWNVFKAMVYCTLNEKRVYDVLTMKMDVENPSELEVQARDIAQLASWLSGMLSKAQSYLRIMKKKRKLMRIEKTWTDFDRTIFLDEACNDAVTLVDLIEDKREFTLKEMVHAQSLLKRVGDDVAASRMERST